MNSLSFRCKYITRKWSSFKQSSTQRINLQMCWILLTSDYATHFGHHNINIGTLCVLIWFALLSLWIKRCFTLVFQIAKTLGSTSVRYWSEAKVSDWCLIDVDPIGFDLWDTSCQIKRIVSNHLKIDSLFKSCHDIIMHHITCSYEHCVKYVLSYIILQLGCTFCSSYRLYLIFWLYLYFLNILYFFKYSCTNIFHRRSPCILYSIHVHVHAN